MRNLTWEQAMSISTVEWNADAACKGHDPKLWLNTEPATLKEIQEREAEPKRICAGCPVRVKCLETALSVGSLPGIWGGLAEAEQIRFGEGRTARRWAR